MRYDPRARKPAESSGKPPKKAESHNCAFAALFLAGQSARFFGKRALFSRKGESELAFKRCVQLRRAILSVLLTAIFLLFLLPPSASAAADYQDGTYTVPVSIDGLGRHNIVWPSGTLHVEGGALFLDITFERVDPKDHAPRYDWLATSLGTVTPVIDDAALTATFYRVPIPGFDPIPITVLTSAMSAPVEVEYTLNVDGSAVPLAAVETPEPTPIPTAAPAETPAPTEAPEETPELTPEPTTEPTPEPTEAPAPTEAPTPEPTAEATPAPTPAPAPAEAPEQPPTAVPASYGTIALIAAAVVVAALVAFFAVRAARKKK